MNQPAKTYQPEYFSKFECITTRCEDTCCSGWQITLDHDFVERCKAYPDPEIRIALLENIVLKGRGAPAGGFAQIKLSGGACPFLTAKKLCGVQRAAGEAFLSNLCYNFPRNYNLVDGVLEKSMSASCPEAAQLILFSPEPVRFIERDADGNERTADAPMLDSLDPKFSGKPYPHFQAIRAFCISLLQNRDYPLEDRLILLGRFCLELEGGAAVPDVLIGAYEENIALRRFDELLGSVPDAPAAQLKTLAALLEFRLKTGAAGSRFTGCFDRFRQGLRYSNAAAQADLSWSWRTGRSDFYEPFTREHASMLENYLVNYVFSTLFPLGPQSCPNPKSVYMLPRGVFSAYMLLVIHFAFIKNLLIGLAAYHGEDFGEAQVAELVQAFSKDVGHDAPYLEHVLKFFEEHGMMNMAYAAMIVRN